MRIAEAFCKMRLSDFCSTQDIDRAIAVTVDSFVGSQKISCKKALARARNPWELLTNLLGIPCEGRKHHGGIEADLAVAAMLSVSFLLEPIAGRRYSAGVG
jgi:hypothetical protein